MRSILLLCLLACTCAGMELNVRQWRPRGENLFAVSEHKDGKFHLKDDSDGKEAGIYQYRFSPAELKEALGRRVRMTALVTQLAADKPNGIQIALSCRKNDGKYFTFYDAIPEAGEAAGVRALEVTLDVPDDATQLLAQLVCTAGAGNRGEAIFEKVEITVLPPGPDDTGNIAMLEQKPVILKWSAAGASVERVADGIRISGAGTLALKAEKPLNFSGSSSELGELLLEYETAEAFKIDIVCWGQRHQTITVPKTQFTRYRFKISLDKILPPRDLENFNALEITVTEPFTLKKAQFHKLNYAGEQNNLLPDPSFESGAVLPANYLGVGDYRLEKNVDKAMLDDRKAYHGKRSLRLEPGGSFTVYSRDRNAKGSVFSTYATGPGKLEIQYQSMQFAIHGSNSAVIHKQEFELTDEWRRVHVAAPEFTERINGFIGHAVIRNTGSAPVWIDAMQLENRRINPSAFKPERSFAMVIGADSFKPLSLERYQGLKIPEQKQTGSVSLQAINFTNKDLASSVIRGGVPFADGVLFDTDGVELRDRDGQVISAQFSALARRPKNGSIISLCTDFQLDLKAGERKDLTLHYGVKTAAAGKALAVQSGDKIVIDTGVKKFTLTLGADSLFEGNDCFFAVKTPDGKIHRGIPEIVKVEENGPLSCTVFLRGKAMLAYELRITAYRGKPYLKIDCSFERNFKDKSPLLETVSAIYFRLPGGENYRVDGFSGKGDAAFIQRYARVGEGGFEILTKEKIVAGRLSGKATAGSTTVSVHELAELAPRGFGFENGALNLYLWPDIGVASLDVTSGLSGTMSFLYASEAVELPEFDGVLLQADPQYVAGTGVYDRFLTADESRKLFPRISNALDSAMESVERHTAVNGFYSFGDYGDFGNRNYFANHETDGVRDLWMDYFRIGSWEAFKQAAAHSRHQRDVDVCHVDYGAAANMTHSAWTNQSYHFHTGHYWMGGVIWHYLLTGDRRSLDTAISSAALAIAKAGIKYKGGRERHRMLMHLADLYELSGNPAIRDAFELQYNWNGISEPSGYYGAIAHDALLKMYKVTGEKKYMERLKEEAPKFRQANNVNFPPMPENLSAPPTIDGSAQGGRDAAKVAIGGHLAFLFNDPKYISYLNRGNRDPLIWLLLSPNIANHGLMHFLPGLAAMKQFGIQENSEIPYHYHFINRFA